MTPPPALRQQQRERDEVVLKRAPVKVVHGEIQFFRPHPGKIP